jgi:hypothetical protein
MLIIKNNNFKFSITVVDYNDRQSQITMKLRNKFLFFTYIAPITTKEHIMSKIVQTVDHPIASYGEFNLDSKKTFSRVEFRKMTTILEDNDIINILKD